MTRIYISGPMTNIADWNFPAFAEAAHQLRVAGYSVEDPSEKGIINDWTWADYLKWDLRALTFCDGVAVLPGWPSSRGASLEVHVASALSIPVGSVEFWLRDAERAA